MKAKVLVLAAVLVALGALLARKSPETKQETAPAAQAPPSPAALANIRQHPALASYRVDEEEAVEGVLPYRGANYEARVGPEGLSFEAEGRRISLRARRIEQGGTSLDLAAGKASKLRFAAASVERGHGVTEEFIFENRRAEHLVRVAAPLGEGALTVRVAVETNQSGPVQEVHRGDSAWKDQTLADGGLVFTDAEGKPGVAYHGAMAVDAAGRKQLLDARWQNGEIALEVPALFLKGAAYPVVVDPWLELDFSATGQGISLSGTVSESVAISVTSGNAPCVAWSDARTGNYDIYFKYWNGEEWIALGTSADAGGVSANAGRSVNPSIGFFTPTNTNLYHPFLAWEDNTSGTTNIYAKFWTGTAWAPLGGSTTSGGVSLSLGTPCRSPQALGVQGLVDNVATGTVPDRVEYFPTIVWEIEGVGIACRFFYPGDNRTQAPPADWYDHPSGFFITQDATASRPSAIVNSSNQIVIAWQASDTTVPEIDIFAGQTDMTGNLTVASGNPIPGPSSNWVSLGNVSQGAAPALSAQPSLALDGADQPWVAWQESVGAEREIYVRFFNGAWTEVAGSGSGNGISSTSVVGVLTNSSAPSIAINPFGPARPVVAWEDDASGNTEIYVRRLNAGNTAWDQVADEGSAMLVAPEVTGNNGGVSRTSGFSLRPRALVAPDGAISVAWRDSATGNFDLFLRRFHDNAPSNLAQASLTNNIPTSLATGGTSASVNIQFTAVLTAESPSVPIKLRMQLEVQPSTTAFTGADDVLLESAEVDSGGTAVYNFTGLPNVNYHWRVRSLDAINRTSPWISFGGNADGLIDFRVDSSAAGAGGINTVSDTNDKKDKCGLTGLEAAGLLALAAFLRRRRRA